MKYSQKEVDDSFEAYRKSTYHSSSDVEYIQKVIQNTFNVTLTEAQTIDFWRWRSDEWCASWLITAGDQEIITWFTVWMDWYKRDFKGFPLRKEHISDPTLNMFREDDNL